MEHEVNKQTIQMNEMAFQTVVEQSVEIDYMLPDYYMDVFKVLKVEMTPHILSEHIAERRLLVDGVTDIKIIYLGAEGNQMHCIEQKQLFSKTIELKEDCADGFASVRVKCDYVNCRAQNSRRLDVRGSMSLMVQVYRNHQVEVLSDCEQLQIHKKQVSCSTRRMQVSKEFLVKEELKLGAGKPPIVKVLNYTAQANFTDYKALSNKVICKGDILLHTLYLDEKLSTPEVMEHLIPMSQVIDCLGVEEHHWCHCFFDVVKYDIDLQVDAEGKSDQFIAEIGLRVYCETAYNEAIEIIDDCYSTLCEVESSTVKHQIESVDRVLQETYLQKHTMKHNQSDLALIYDLRCDVVNSSIKLEGDQLMLLSSLQISALACDNQGVPMSISQNIPSEIKLCERSQPLPISFQPSLSVVSCGYHIVSPTEIELRVELSVRGILYYKQEVQLIADVTFDPEKPKKRLDDTTLRLYFADQGENIWKIAKRYNTSVAAILENNVIEDETLNARGMIFIPIVD